jgi:hypothetical protein
MLMRLSPVLLRVGVAAGSLLALRQISHRADCEAILA